MNKSRVPSLLLTLFFTLSILSGLTSRAQTTTNTAILQKASQQRSADDKTMQQLVTRTALQHGWPLVMRDKKGRKVYLKSINSRGLPEYITVVDNIISAATIGTSRLWPGGSTGLNLNGSSTNLKGKIGIWDEGVVRPTHVELAGRVTQVDAAQGDNVLSDHSTHVSGTMIATGVNPVAKGMANGALLLQCWDYNNDEAEMMTAAANGLLTSNHSYGTVAGWNPDATFPDRWDWSGNPGDTVDVSFGLYNSDAQIWDSISYNAPYYLIAKAAGNNPGDTGPAVGGVYWRYNAAGNFYNAGARPAGISNNYGYETIPTFGNAKNILVIGAVNPIPGGYTSPSDVVWSGFSSYGPTGDGRIKPDLVADGVNVLSSISTADNAYDIYSGTSMATPAATGSGFLLQQYYSQLHGTATFMRSATLKGLLIHTADEAGLYPGPDYLFGWGLIDMVRAAGVITSDNTDHSQQIIESSLTQGSQDSRSYTVVASGKTALWATICWTDPPGTPVANAESIANFQDVGIKLVNDLDLRITDNTTNTVYMPWVLNPAPASRGNAATKGDNIRDNVEKVELTDSAVPGRTYTITVTHKSTLQRGSQAYSLIISGAGGVAPCTSSSTSGGADITQVTLNNLSTSIPTNSSCPGYVDNTTLTPANLPVGQTMNISVSTSSCNGTTNNRAVAVYIDYNNNDTFENNELAYLSSSAPAGTVSGSFTVPVTATPGTTALMRIITEETSTPSVITPCGDYTNGETQDYRVTFTNPTNDVGVANLAYPNASICSSDSQLVSVTIHNFGTVAQTGGVPVSTIVTQGGNTVASFSAVCMDSIPAGGEVVYTYSDGVLPTTAGGSYTFTSHTALSTDFDTYNDSNTTTVAINAAAAAANAAATVCGSNATSVVLHATTTGDDIAVWYDSQTATTPIAAGNNTTTTDVQKTYYVGLNDLKAKGGALNSASLAAAGSSPGIYYPFGGQFMDITTSVPLTLESARLYVGNRGQVTFTLATLASLNSSGYSYFPVTSVTLDVYPSKQVPQSGEITVNAGDFSDTGAIYYLNIPIPNPGSYILIAQCSDNTNLFLNTGITTNPYPISIPGIFSVTGNSNVYDPNKASDSVTYFEKYYYPLYDIGIRLEGCPGPLTAVTPSQEASPTITLTDSILRSSADSGNAWYVNDSLTASTGVTDTARIAGVYYTTVTDPVTGCVLQSNSITYTPGGGGNASIGLRLGTNPNKGSFLLQFYMSTTANTSIELYDVFGNRVYEEQNPDFSGSYAKTIDVLNLASGMYVLRIIHGNDTYHTNVIIDK
jgi:Subtilase family/GEVED domain/Secretion system C-terminal sorting domain